MAKSLINKGFQRSGNCFKSRPLGVIDDQPATKEEATTICGAMNKTISDLISVNPDVKIILLTPLQTFGLGVGNQYEVNNSAGYSVMDVNNAVKAIAQKYNCSCVDMYEVVGVDNYQEYLLSDVLHVSNAGYVAMANHILGQFAQ